MQTKHIRQVLRDAVDTVRSAQATGKPAMRADFHDRVHVGVKATRGKQELEAYVNASGPAGGASRLLFFPPSVGRQKLTKEVRAAVLRCVSLAETGE